tara:strand:+ start:12606 stop:13100 length:495 start_codon:yes stop_codon:yes gene_type:complete
MEKTMSKIKLLILTVVSMFTLSACTTNTYVISNQTIEINNDQNVKEVIEEKIIKNDKILYYNKEINDVKNKDEYLKKRHYKKLKKRKMKEFFKGTDELKIKNHCKRCNKCNSEKCTQKKDSIEKAKKFLGISDSDRVKLHKENVGIFKKEVNNCNKNKSNSCKH